MTFAALFLMAAASVLILVFLGGLPGRIALARKHPEAEAVKVMGGWGSSSLSRGYRPSVAPSNRQI